MSELEEHLGLSGGREGRGDPLDRPYLSRRGFIKVSLAAGAALVFPACLASKPQEVEAKVAKTQVFVIKTQNREEGISALLNQYDMGEFKGKRIALKANYNSADYFPASTHLDTLKLLVNSLKDAGASDITLAERSGMGATRSVLEERGVKNLSEELGFNMVVLDDLPDEGWIRVEPEGTHWSKGFLLAKVFGESEKVIQTCCLKTHRFGGHFTLSLKNSVGAVAKFDPKNNYNYMSELHSSAYQRLMIAEINRAYENHLIVMDGIKAFVNAGPDKGEMVEPGVILAGRDRIAVDAVGVAILRLFGTTPEVSRGKIFEQEQIKRAADLGVGVRSSGDIELVAVGDESRNFVQKVENVLKSG